MTLPTERAAAAVDPDIRRAWTLPAEVYSNREVWERLRERLFARSWQWAGDLEAVRTPGWVAPSTLLPGLLDEPLVLARDAEDRLRCLSNVCTHRGALVAESAGPCRVLRCRYHGRRFRLDGSFLSMPGFEEAEDFPSPADDLPELPLGIWGPLAFTGLEPEASFAEWIGPFAERLDGLPIAGATFDATRSRDYLVRAHWALYVENYLEGFHIPFVHPGLAAALDHDAYTTELHGLSNLQVGVAAGGEDAFDRPDPELPGVRVAAYYWWLFPNTMVNVYPWGVSLNVVQPLAPDRTRVLFRSYVADPDRLEAGAGAALDRVEREDEAVVEAVARGVRSRLYRRGRYSPRHERGVHHFHRLLEPHLDESGG